MKQIGDGTLPYIKHNNPSWPNDLIKIPNKFLSNTNDLNQFTNEICGNFNELDENYFIQSNTAILTTTNNDANNINDIFIQKMNSKKTHFEV